MLGALLAMLALALPSASLADGQGNDSPLPTGNVSLDLVSHPGDTVFTFVQDADGYHVFLNISNPAAPVEYAFRVGGDAELLEKRNDGSVLVRNAGGETIAVFDIPWGVDANGSSVPVEYEAHGDLLIKKVAHDGNAEVLYGPWASQYDGRPFGFPIVADPLLSDIFGFFKNLAKKLALPYCSVDAAIKAVRDPEYRLAAGPEAEEHNQAIYFRKLVECVPTVGRALNDLLERVEDAL